MTGVVEKDVGQIPSVLVNASGLALESPVVARGPHAGACFEARAAIPFHVMDEAFRAEVVADEIFVAIKEEDVNPRLDEVGEEIDGRFGIQSQEILRDHTRAFCPARLLGRVDVEGLDDVRTLEVWGDILQIRWPVHATSWICILFADVVNIIAFRFFQCDLEEFLEEELARVNVHFVLCLGGL